MLKYFLHFSCLTLFYSCVNFDASDEHLENDCKCEAYSQSGKFFVIGKNCHVEACAKTIDGKLKYGYILTNNKCEIIFPFVFDKASGFSDGFAAVKNGTKWGFIDTLGKVVLPFQYLDVKEFDNGLCAIQVDSLWGFINKQGDFVIPPNYISCYNFSDSVCFVQKTNKKWILLNQKGSVIPGPEVDDIENIWPGPNSQQAWVIVDGNRLAFIAKNDRYAYLKEIENWTQIDSMDINNFSKIPKD